MEKTKILKEKVVIDFIGDFDGSKIKFIAELNKLNNKWMWTWDNWINCFFGTEKDINTFMNNIQKKCKIIFISIH